MNFDYTYITIFGYTLFEPVVILTNLIFCTLCIYFFNSLSNNKHAYARQMSLFILLMGLSSIFGAIGHAVHHQLGLIFFNVVLFVMNGLSLFSVYYCFKGPHTYYQLNKTNNQKYTRFILVWILLMLLISAIKSNFLLIKIHAGISLIYSLWVHYTMYKRHNERGSALVVTGIVVAFFSIITHSLKISLHEWFNHKDISHVIMIISLVIIYRGIKMNADNLTATA